ncbi:MAG: effector binding domain-containing protein, partial [Oscillospiraceae bacterium]|nr:effector binding domain-containing protein [Oscillospiraceae bacterium]
YENDANGEYDVTIGAEVSSVHGQIDELVIKTIPAGKYAKFEVEGPMECAVCDFWQKLWQMDLPRNYKGDFEEYIGGDEKNCKVNVYIGINA